MILIHEDTHQSGHHTKTNMATSMTFKKIYPQLFVVTTSTQFPSSTIPMPRSHIRRTISEEQLNEEMAVAEFRDICMLQRINSRRSRKQSVPKLSNNVINKVPSRYFDCTPNRSKGFEEPTLLKSSYQSRTLYEYSIDHNSSKSQNQQVMKVQSQDYLYEENEDWSIPGFSDESSDVHQHHYGIPIVEPDYIEHERDDGVFMIEL